MKDTLDPEASDLPGADAPVARPRPRSRILGSLRRLILSLLLFASLFAASFFGGLWLAGLL